MAVAGVAANSASARPRCDPDASGPPVGQYVSHHCYPGLSTSTSKPPKTQKFVAPSAKLKKKYQQRRVMKFQPR